MTQNKKQNYGKKLAIGLAVVFSAAALAMSATTLVMGAKHNGWFDKKVAEPDKEIAASAAGLFEENGSMGLMKIKNSPGLSLFGSKTMTPTNAASMTLTATITPADTFDKTVSWSISWETPSSTWANGKTVTSYVTVTPTSAGALTATVTCKQAFAEKVIVTCASTVNSEAKATATFEYGKKITACSLSSTLGSMSGENFRLNTSNKNYGTVTSNPTYSIFTKDDTFTTTTEYKLSNAFLSTLKNNGFTNAKSTDSYSTLKTSDTRIGDFLSKNDKNGVLNIGGNVGDIYNRVGTTWNNMVKALTAMNGAAIGTLKVTYTGTYSTYVAEFDVIAPADGLEITASGVTLNNGNYVF